MAKALAFLKGRRARQAAKNADVTSKAAPASPTGPTIWENLITLNSDVEPAFSLLEQASVYHDRDQRLSEWVDLDYRDAMSRDHYPLPLIEDREGYYGQDHFSYWASGLRDARLLLDAATEFGTGEIEAYLDLGCASGRVLRHIALERPGCRAIGCDINRLHVEWCNAHLPDNCSAFQNHSVPSLPIEDNSLDAVSAYSVFPHLEALATAW